MKVKLFILLTTLCSVITSCGLEPEADEVYTASGYANLIDTVDGNYRHADDSRGILISVEGTNIIGTTDSTGYFTIENIPTDKHTFYFYKDGYGIQRSVDENLTYNYHQASDSLHSDLATFRVELLPLSGLHATIDSVFYDDTVYIHTYFTDVVLGQHGDTVDHGNIHRDTIHADGSILTIQGSINGEAGLPIFHSNVVLLFSLSPNVSTDSATWIMDRGYGDYPDNAFTITGSSYSFKLYEQDLNILTQGAFTKGSTLYVVAYARPGQHASSRIGFGTEFRSEPSYPNYGDVFIKRYFTTIGQYPSVVRSFVLK